MLTTFQIVHKDKVISPALITIREYGTWFEKVFDEYTTQMELYMKSVKKTGESVLEWHPGTRIGNWFDKHEITTDNLRCWYILQDSTMMEKLKKHKLAELRDAVPISVNDAEGRRMLRVYTPEQIQLYIRSNIDKKFDIRPYIGKSIQVKVKDSDLDKLIMSKVKSNKKKLF